MTTTTPTKITREVSDFCRGLSPHPPVYLAVEPGPDDKPLECFLNVLRRVETAGGEMVTGWLIHSWPGVFIEAQHHAVWSPPEGGLVNITPWSEPRVLFVPDPTASYDPADYHGRDSVRRGLVDHPAVSAFIEEAERITAIKMRTTGPRVVVDTRELAMHAGRMAHAYGLLLDRFLGPNDSCFCGSGRKYKRCHRGRHPPFATAEFLAFYAELAGPPSGRL